MKRLILFVIFVFGMAAMASAEDISGHTFTACGCTISFVQGPFGPGESGVATLKCGGDTVDYSYIYNPPILDLAGLQFVLVDGKLYYLDPAGLVLIEE